MSDTKLTSALAAAPHDDKCESELTSHGYTPCRCEERAEPPTPAPSSEGLIAARMHGSIHDYHVAPSGDGPLAEEWKDKPHRLLYDVLGTVQAQAEQLAALTAEQAKYDAMREGYMRAANTRVEAAEAQFATLRELIQQFRGWDMLVTHPDGSVKGVDTANEFNHVLLQLQRVTTGIKPA